MLVSENPEILSVLGDIQGICLVRRRETASARRRYRDTHISPCQRAWQAAFAQADHHWQQLDELYKQQWRDWRPWAKPWGYNLCMKVNIPRAYHVQPLLDSPPDFAPWI